MPSISFCLPFDPFLPPLTRNHIENRLHSVASLIKFPLLQWRIKIVTDASVLSHRCQIKQGVDSLTSAHLSVQITMDVQEPGLLNINLCAGVFSNEKKGRKGSMFTVYGSVFSCKNKPEMKISRITAFPHTLALPSVMDSNCSAATKNPEDASLKQSAAVTCTTRACPGYTIC